MELRYNPRAQRWPIPGSYKLASERLAVYSENHGDLLAKILSISLSLGLRRLENDSSKLVALFFDGHLRGNRFWTAVLI